LIVWVIAGLLGMATGLRIGWGLVNQQSVVSGAMIVALGNLAVVAALNWPPAALLVDTALRWPNIAVGISEMALVMSAAGSCVMITSVAAGRGSGFTRRLAFVQYGIATVIAIVTLVLFLDGGREPEMSPQEYLAHHVGQPGEAWDWLVPLLYVLLALSVVAWVGMRLSSASRRGRALLLFTAGMTLIVVVSAYLVTRAVGRSQLLGLGAAAHGGGLDRCATRTACHRIAAERNGTATPRYRYRGTSARAAGVPGGRAAVADLRCALSRGRTGSATRRVGR
jgi:hypothetical protein